MPKKKKVFYHSDFSLLKTGFGKVGRLILSHLYGTGKYDIVHFCCGMEDGNGSYDRVPWKNLGCLPNSQEEIQRVKNDPKLAQLASYGAMKIDEVMKREKPDVYIGVQDIWGCEFATKKKWWKDSNMAIWTTLDSLPILPMAVSTAGKVKHFWCWSDFATKSLRKLGHEHVKTLRGPLDESNFYRLSDSEKKKSRQRNSLVGGVSPINNEDFVVGFVFRNQLRKSVPNLIEGFKLFLDNNPEVQGADNATGRAKLLLHTNFSEGWGIMKLAEEHGVDRTHILTTYVCNACGQYNVGYYQGVDQDCPHCGSAKTYNTTGIQAGVTESQLNEVYNLMDVYCHPFTSGGQEIPIQEAKLVELPTLVTNYSCGADSCVEEAGSLALDWSEYREHGTEFIKASTDPKSIALQLQKVYDMPKEERREIGRKGRDWVIENFSIEKIGKEIENFIDSCPDINVDKVYDVESNKNPSAIIDDSLETEDRIISMYKEILDMEVTPEDQGYQHWIAEHQKGTPMQDIETFFRETARREIESVKSLRDYVDEEDGGKRILYVIPERATEVFLSSSLFRSLSETYPEHKLYVATLPKYFSLLNGNKYVYKIIPYEHSMNNVYELEGYSNRSGSKQEQEKIFDMVLLSHANTQIIPNYTRNGLDKLPFKMKY
jgi:glycosyltransferase involved in cell wall biosynthesis